MLRLQYCPPPRGWGSAFLISPERRPGMSDVRDVARPKLFVGQKSVKPEGCGLVS